MALSLGPLRIAKRQWKRPWSMDPFGQNDSLDQENGALAGDIDSDYDESLASSRATSKSHEPMLHSSSPPRHMASAYDDRIPRKKFNRIFTLALGSSVLLFILLLTKLSHNSSQNVATAKPQPISLPYESFPFLKRYHGGIRTLIPRSENDPEYPGDEEELRAHLLNTSLSHGSQFRKRDVDVDSGSKKSETSAEPNLKLVNLPHMEAFDPFLEPDPDRRECFLDGDLTIKIPKLHVYRGCVRGFPDNVLGSYDMFGLQKDVCFDRFGRLGPYGFGYSRKMGGTGAGLEGDRDGIDQIWAEDPEVDFSNVRWAQIMTKCAAANAHRFDKTIRGTAIPLINAEERLIEDTVESLTGRAQPDMIPHKREEASTAIGNSMPEMRESTPKKNRTCVIIRTWYDYNYNPEDIMYLRSLISELSLASGSEYMVHFLIHVKNNDLPIWSNDEVYERVLNESLPEEFHGMGTLWSDAQLMFIYGGMNTRPFRDIHLHGAYRSAFMPVQYFAYRHPEFDFFWHWEMDARYTGHWYHLFDRIGSWAKQQPRKGLWERNARFYVPKAHGSWDDFRQMVRVQTEHGTSSKANILGPQLDPPAADPNSPQSSMEKSVWGAESPLHDDLDSSQDPVPPTSYAKDDYSWGVGEDADLITFNPLFDPEGTDWNLEKDVTGYNVSSGKYPPRRVAIITASRLSRRLLKVMHDETSLHKRTMFSEMWPASCALQHGLKAVYAPHPEYIDRRWPTDYLAAVFNGGRNGASGGARTSPFNDAHQDNFRGVSWYYNSGFPGNLWRRWLGYKVDNDGGEAFELANEGRMCLPGLLLHPVKQIEMIYEHREEDSGQ